MAWWKTSSPALSRLRWLFVIARNSSFTYKGRAVDVKQVGRELGVRYVLEGSVRKAGRQGAHHRPAHRRRRPARISGRTVSMASLEDIFDLQDQVTSSVVGTIAPKLEQAEIERSKRKPTESLDAYDYFLRGMAAFHQFYEGGQRRGAGDVYTSRRSRSAIRCRVWDGSALLPPTQRDLDGWTISAREIAEAERLARRPPNSDADDAVALSTAGFTLIIVVGEVSEWFRPCRPRTCPQSKFAWGWHVSAIAKACLGEPETALEHAARAMRLSPQDPQMSGMHVAVAFAHFIAGRYEEALVEAEAAVRGRVNFFVGPV